MTNGTLFGIGVGPGDPELLTLKAARILGRCRHVFAPSPARGKASVALAIARQHVGRDVKVEEIEFPMVTDTAVLEKRWDQAAESVCAVLTRGEDACFLTLGDPLLYSTYIYLLRAVRQRLPELDVVTVPGVTAFSAAAALTGVPVGVGKQAVRIVPTADDLETVREALASGDTIVLMKIGKRFNAVFSILEETGLLKRAILVSRAGLPGERIETDLTGVRGDDTEAGYLSVIIVAGGKALS